MKILSKQSERRNKRGFLTMELVFVLPILLLVIMALLEFCLLFFARSSVVEASRIGARHATYAGSSIEDIENEVRKVLSPKMQQNMKVTADIGEHSGDVVVVTVAVPMTNASPDLLSMIGFGLRNRNLYSETRMIRE